MSGAPVFAAAPRGSPLMGLMFAGTTRGASLTPKQSYFPRSRELEATGMTAGSEPGWGPPRRREAESPRGRSSPRPTCESPPHAPPRPAPRPRSTSARLREALRKRPGVGRRRWRRCHVPVAARAGAAATATVAREVEEEVGLALKPDPDPVLCARVGESPAGLERSADREASTDLTTKMKPDETPMFDPSLLKEVDWSQNTATFSPAISPTHPGEGLVLRPLCTADLNRGFFKVLGQLTETGVVNPEQFMKSFEHMKKSGDYYVTVVEDVTLGQIVATATLIIEHKFIHSCAKRGRVEDVVVSDECRGKQLGKLLLSTLTLLSKKLNCYKITLECLPQNVGFYKKFGYTVSEENYMCRRFLK